MNHNQQEIDELIARVLTKEADEREQSVLSDWISASVDHEVYFSEFKKTFELTGNSIDRAKFNTDKAWHKVQRRIHDKKNNILKLRYIWTAVAAVFIISLSLLAYNYWTDNNQQLIQLVSIQKVLNTYLPDSTKVTLNVNSSIAYDKAVFRNEKELTLSGEAFFDVRKDQSKKLTIRCGDILIKDIGTKFNVKAYADSLLLIVSVKEGSVKLYSLNHEGVIINAGFEGVYDKRSGAFYVQPLRNKNIAAYHDRILIFENTSVAEAIGLLEKLYGISVRIDNEAIKKCRFSATFNNESIDTILDILSETLNLRLSKSNKKYEISGEGCYNEI